MREVTPYQDSAAGKKAQVSLMFDNIAGSYDFLNHFFSMGIDILWRKKAVRLLKPLAPKKILDIATGTGDFAFELTNLNPEKIIGIDISEGMLEIGKEKVRKRKLDNIIDLQKGDSENIQFDDNYFDALTVAFGVRNFENLQKGLAEMHRVLKPGGQAVILEFSKPKGIIKPFFHLYFKLILPALGALISKDKTAYQYLYESAMAFPEGEELQGILKKIGYKSAYYIPVSGSIATIYVATK